MEKLFKISIGGYVQPGIILKKVNGEWDAVLTEEQEKAYKEKSEAQANILKDNCTLVGIRLDKDGAIKFL
jgi:hypothetical protein